MARTRFYKAATLELNGPHFNQPGQLYLPGTTHRATLNVASTYGSGIHFTSHPRVAARWGEVVLEVEVLGRTYKIPEQVTPRFRRDIPSSLAMGRYNKYRTDELRVVRIIGLASYGYGDDGSHSNAVLHLADLNRVLAAHGRAPMRLTGTSLETLRTPSFQLWELEEGEVEIERYTITVDVIVYTGIAPSDFRHRLERAAEDGVGKLSYVQTAGVAHVTPSSKEPIGG